MAGITSTGIGSGLDISGLVQQLVAAEGQPAQQRLDLQESKVQAKLSAYGSLKSALTEFRDQLDAMRELDSFLTRKASSTNEEFFTVTAGTGASPASYSVDVVERATAQKLVSGAFTDADTAVGTGTLHVDVGGTAFDVDITDDNDTLSGIRDAINAAADNSGVSATIVNAEDGSYLILSGEKTGSAQTVTITQSGGDGGLAALEYDPGQGLASLTETSAARDALIRIDGLDVVSGTNSIGGAIDGVTIDVVAASAGETAELAITNDTDDVRATINAFVESYNQLAKTLDQLTAYNAETEVAAPLLGDSTLRGIRDQLRREMSDGVSDVGATFGTLREIGIETRLDGKLAVVEEDLTAALAGDFPEVGRLFAGTDGFAVRLHGLVDGFLSSDGGLETRTDGLNKSIELFTDQREALNERLASLESRLLRQFNALDALVGQLSSTSNFLTAQLANLPTPGGRQT